MLRLLHCDFGLIPCCDESPLSNLQLPFVLYVAAFILGSARSGSFYLLSFERFFSVSLLSAGILTFLVVIPLHQWRKISLARASYPFSIHHI